MHAGHYIPRSLSGFLFFDERNVHAQCYRCNIHLSGNSDEYAQRIVKVYGESELERLRRDKRKIKQWTKEDLMKIINKYAPLNR